MSVRSSEGLAGLSIESFLFNDRSAGSAWFQLNWKSAFLPISPLSLLNTHTRLTGNRNHFFSFESNESSSTCFRSTWTQSDSRLDHRSRHFPAATNFTKIIPHSFSFPPEEGGSRTEKSDLTPANSRIPSELNSARACIPAYKAARCAQWKKIRIAETPSRLFVEKEKLGTERKREGGRRRGGGLGCVDHAARY